MDNAIQQFLSSPAFGVVGASNNRVKFGNKVLRCYLQHQMEVYPVNSIEKIIEGTPAVKHIDNLPNNVQSISIITPPPFTEEIVKQAIKKGIKNIWMQPGAESQAAIDNCKAHDINIIAGGPCILVQLGFTDT